MLYSQLIAFHSLITCLEYTRRDKMLIILGNEMPLKLSCCRLYLWWLPLTILRPRDGRRGPFEALTLWKSYKAMTMIFRGFNVGSKIFPFTSRTLNARAKLAKSKVVIQRLKRKLNFLTNGICYWKKVKELCIKIRKTHLNLKESLSISCYVSNTRDSVSSGDANTETTVEIRRAAEHSCRNSRCLDSRWNTVSIVWYISSQSKQKVRSKRRSKIVKIHANQDWVSKPHSRLWFSVFELDELLMSLRRNMETSNQFSPK